MGSRKRFSAAVRREGFTLMEILVATALILFMMLVLVQIFAVVAGTASLSQSLREMDQEANSAMTVLRSDLEGITVTPDPPRDPGAGEGYFEYSENSLADREGEDTDDVIAFTVRLIGGRGSRAFQGRFGNDGFLAGTAGIPSQNFTTESTLAEVCYFVRGGKLYRRQLLIMPRQPAIWDTNKPWYAHFDVSVRPPTFPAFPTPQINSLGDLTDRQNRFSHDPRIDIVNMNYQYPFRAIEFLDQNVAGNPGSIPFLHEDNDSNGNTPVEGADGILGNADDFPGRFAEIWFGRPLLRETSWGDLNTSAYKWNLPEDVANFYANAAARVADTNGDGLMDGYSDSNGDGIADTGYVGPYFPNGTDDDGDGFTDEADEIDQRISEDILLTGVLSFDVKVYDPGAPILVDTPTGTTVGPPYDLNNDGTYNELNNATVVGFGAYVDLGYGISLHPNNLPNGLTAPLFTQPTLGMLQETPLFWHNGTPAPPTNPNVRLLRTYDTWSTSYENDGIDQDLNGEMPYYANGIDDNGNGLVDELIDTGTDGIDNHQPGQFGFGLVDERPNGLDDDLDGVVDNIEEHEWEAPPPYAVPLRGIQIKIRLLDPTSGQAREYTVTHSFVK